MLLIKFCPECMSRMTFSTPPGTHLEILMPETIFLAPPRRTIIWLPHFIQRIIEDRLDEPVIFDILCYTPDQAEHAISFWYAEDRYQHNRPASEFVGNISILVDGEHHLVQSFDDIQRIREMKESWKKPNGLILSKKPDL